MKNNFKNLLLKISSLPTIDQRWILKHLSQEKKDIFQQLQGEVLLTEARRFGKFNIQIPADFAPRLPSCCETLSGKPALFKAIILQQGKFLWEQAFMDEQHDRDEITQCFQNSVKPAAKKMLFETWVAEITPSP